MRNDELNDGGQAFPRTRKTGVEGMTLRDYFAAKAMEAAATNPAGANGFSFEDRAEWAYAQADAMLAARGAGEFGSTGA